MPKYRVTLHVDTVDIVEAENPYMAAIAAARRHGDGVAVADVRPAFGRTAGGARSRPVKTKKVAKKRKPLSTEARAKLAKNLEKARAARARNIKAAKKSAKKR